MSSRQDERKRKLAIHSEDEAQSKDSLPAATRVKIEGSTTYPSTSSGDRCVSRTEQAIKAIQDASSVSIAQATIHALSVINTAGGPIGEQSF
jgi:hypothetical protein